MIRIEAPDWSSIEFPEGTADSVILDVMRREYGGPTAPAGVDLRAQAGEGRDAYRARVEASRGAVQPSAASQAMDAQAEGAIDMGRPLSYRLQDNLIGINDGVMSPGEKLGTALNIGGESITLGLVGDEAAAAADSLTGRGSYDDRLASYRGDERQFREENPTLAFGSEFLPAFLPGAGLATAMGKVGTTAGRVGLGLLGGAAAGGTQGFMEGEGGWSNRLNNAVIPAALGGAIGGALEPAGMLASAAWRRLGPGASAAARTATQRMGLDDTAARIVGNAVERDLPYAADNLANAGPDAVNGMVGRNTKGLLDWIANRPGEAGAFVGDRVEGIAARAGQKFSGLLDDVFGQPQGVARTTRNIMQSTADERREAYGEAYERIIDFATPQGQQIEDLLSRVPESAIRDAERLMRAEGVASAQILASVADDGAVRFTSMPDVRTVDYITRALRDMGGFGTGTGKDAGSAFTRLAGQIRGTLDQIVPEYGAARAAGRDAIVNREAVQFGSDLLRRNTPIDVAQDAIEGMGDAELTFARQGVRDYFREIMANVKPALLDQNMDAREALDPLKQILSGAGKDKLTALLGPDEAARVIQNAQEAFTALNLRASVIRGSATAPRQMAEQVLDEGVPRTFGEALEGGSGLLGSMVTATRPLMDSAALQRAMRKDGVASSVARALMAPVRTMPDNSLMVQQLAPAIRAGDQAALRALQNTRSLLGMFGTAATNQMAQ